MNFKTTVEDDTESAASSLIPFVLEKVLHWNEDLQTLAGKAISDSTSLLPSSSNKSLYDVTLQILQSRTSGACHNEWA